MDMWFFDRPADPPKDIAKQDTDEMYWALFVFLIRKINITAGGGIG